MHFATAAVLLMRMYGIPARYATGFAIPAADFDWQDGAGWLANVEDSRSHAWAEIYTDYYGWIPFETTPSYDSGADLSYYGESPQENSRQRAWIQKMERRTTIKITSRLRIRGNKMQTRATILTAKRIWCKMA